MYSWLHHWLVFFFRQSGRQHEPSYALDGLLCVLSAQLSWLLGNQFLHYTLDTNLGVFPHLKRCIKLLGCPLLLQGGLWHSYIWWEYFEATMNTRVLSVFKGLLRQRHCVERWCLIILLWRQREVRHPYFPLCFGALWKGVGCKTFFSCSSEHWAESVKLASVLQLFCEPERGIVALCPIPMDRLVLLTPVLTQVTKVLVKEVRMNAGAPWEHCHLGIKSVLRLPCSSWEKHSGEAHGRLFDFPLLFP